MTSKKEKRGRFFLCVAFISCIFLLFPKYAYTCSCTVEGSSCNPADTLAAKQIIKTQHQIGENKLLRDIAKEFTKYREWIVEDFFRGYFLPETMLMTEQVSAVAMQQAFIVGTMMDSKHQMETQRLFNQLQHQAHKDYQPSESFCAFGTTSRSLAHSERRGKLNAMALSVRQKSRHLGSASNEAFGVAGSFSRADDKGARWTHFVNKYCDPQDNNYVGASSGLVYACGSGGERANRDIDFSRLMEHERTVDVDFSNATPTNDEQDVLALSSNLFGHNSLTRNIDEDTMQNENAQHVYLNLRAVAAKRAVAENSFNALVGLKSSGTTQASNTSPFLGAVMKDLGVPENEVFKLIGNNPSYYAQLEILSKRLYQNPDFYANLYDTPANVSRKVAAMKAVELMVDRAIHESEMRQEMINSVLLSSRLHDDVRRTNAKIIKTAEE